MWFGSFMRRISTNHWCVSSCEQEVRPTYITGDDWLLSRCFFFCPLNTQEPDGALKQIAAEGPSGCVVFGAVQRLQLQQSFRCVCWRVGSLDLEQDQSSLRRQCSTHKNQSRLCSRKEMALTRTHARVCRQRVCVYVRWLLFFIIFNRVPAGPLGQLLSQILQEQGHCCEMHPTIKKKNR